MEFCKFIESVKEEIAKLCGKDKEIIIREVPGIIGVMRTGMSIQGKDEKNVSIVYLDTYYDNFLNGHMSVSSTARDIYQMLSIHKEDVLPDIDLNDFEMVKGRVIYRLVDCKRNEKLLWNVPYIKYCDLAIIFYLLLDRNEKGQMTALIHNEHMEMWRADVDTLYRLAKKNVLKLLPPSVRSMADVISGIVREYMGDDYRDEVMADLLGAQVISPIYILTNQDGNNGAAVILYEGVLKDFAKTVESDLFILPSSIHEMLLIPYEDGVNIRELREMVKHINSTEVPMEDVLSDNVYLYRRETDTVTILK